MGDFDGDHVTEGGATSFSQLLFADDDDDGVVGLDLDQPGFRFCFSSTEKPPFKMLCFGNYQSNADQLFGARSIPQKSGVTCSDSSSVSSGNNSTITTISNSNKKRNGSGKEPAQCTNTVTTRTPAATQRATGKKTKMENPTSAGHAKVRKEKLGERIAALQQLVSPFGKTDTASVLHEAMGYIRFLHDQVQVLCSPYLQHLPDGGETSEEEVPKKDLRSRGLCLVPVACTVHVANNNGADFWSPGLRHNVSPSGKQ